MAPQKKRSTKSSGKKAKPALVKPRPSKRTTTSTKKEKPAIGLWTWITLLVLAIAIGGAIYLGQRAKAPEATATEPPVLSYIFTAEDGAPVSIEVRDSANKTTRIVQGKDGKWSLEEPEKAEANQEYASSIANSISQLQISNASIDTLSLSDMGLDNPNYTIVIKFANGKEHTLELAESPIKTGYYILIDKERKVMVDYYGIYSLVDMVANPPYLNPPTATATEAPTLTETPTPNLSMTPQGTIVTTGTVTTPDLSATPGGLTATSAETAQTGTLIPATATPTP